MEKPRADLRYGLYMPNFGRGATPRILAKLAGDAEKHGWDGFYLWDHLVEYEKRTPIYDSFTSLAAIALKTESLRLGTTVTPVAKSKPWILARQTVALDHLSNGRLTLGVGLGGRETTDYARFGEHSEEHVLARKLDESLEVITGLWTGKPFQYSGKYYTVKRSVFLPGPVQEPRIPIWVAGFWPRKAPFRRAAKWDGTIPLRLPEKLVNTKDIREIIQYVEKNRRTRPAFDVVKIGWTSARNRRKDWKKVEPFVEAGITWWLESLYTKQDFPDKLRSRIRKGPPN